MSFFLIVLILCLVNSINPSSKKNESNLYINFPVSNIELYKKDIANYKQLNQNENYYKEIILDFLNQTKANPIIFLNFMLNCKEYQDLLLDVVKQILNQNNFSSIYNISEIILKDIFNDENDTFINESYKIINNTKTNNIIDYIIDLIEKFNRTYNFVFTQLKKIFNVDGFRKLFNFMYDRFKQYFYNFVEAFCENSKFKTICKMLKHFITTYQDTLVELCYNLIANFGNRVNVTNILKDFVIKYTKDNSSSLFEELVLILKNNTIMKELAEVIVLDDPIADKIMDEILLNENIMKFLIKFFYNETFVTNFADIIENIYNSTYANKKIPEFIKTLYGNNEQYYYMVINFTLTIMRNVFTEAKLTKTISNLSSRLLRKFIFEGPFDIENITQDCKDFINYTFFKELGEYNIDIDFRLFYIKKFMIQSSKNKNDFLTYETCLDEKYDKMINLTEIYDIKPVFLLCSIIDEPSQNKLKDSIYFEKYNYLTSLCVPYGKNSTTKEALCSNEDYNKIIKIMYQLSFNLETATIDSIVLDREKIEISKNDYINCIVIIFILLIPLIIRLFLLIYKICKKKKHLEKGIINRLTLTNENKSFSIQKTEEIINDDNENISFTKTAPKWYRFLNEYFDIIKNGSDLFNFTLNETNFNKFNGITYIKGILGLSMILNIFGQTFFILLNIPTTTLGPFQFYSTLIHPFYAVLIFGLRYSPRIIFSCSGYTLVYKFLCFIEQDPKFCFLKFLALQSYKYILLILISLFVRFSLHFLDVFLHPKKSPIASLFLHKLENANSKYFYNLFSFLFYNLGEERYDNDRDQSVIQYLYLPINEVFLFIFGIALISIGYKYKYKIDIIIIILIILIYLAKLFLFIFYMKEKQIYTTLYFYLFGYGAFMLNPLFNLPSFLIGMFFGLVNFTIQRGVNNICEENNYSQLYSIDLAPTLKANIDSKEEDIKKNNNYDNIPSNKSLENTYAHDIMSNSILEEKNDLFKISDNKTNIGIKKNQTINFNIDISENEIVKDMPFLISSIIFTNFHRKNQDKIYLKIILIIFILIICFFIFIHYIITNYTISRYIDTDVKKSDNLSLDKLIPNNFLNIIYVIDIEIVVFLINWICFYLYFKGGQFNDFLSSMIWAFFIKSYFSYALVLSPTILYIFYQSETVITITIYNIFIYSLISIFLLFIFVIIYYSCYEYPLKKIFKTLKIRMSYTNIDDDEELDYDEIDSIK